jgi:glucokinase
VRIEDTGSGLDPEIVPKLFSKFTANLFRERERHKGPMAERFRQIITRVWPGNSSSISNKAIRDRNQRLSGA